MVAEYFAGCKNPVLKLCHIRYQYRMKRMFGTSGLLIHQVYITINEGSIC
jgi:hypothetical protein